MQTTAFDQIVHGVLLCSFKSKRQSWIPEATKNKYLQRRKQSTIFTRVFLDVNNLLQKTDSVFSTQSQIDHHEGVFPSAYEIEFCDFSVSKVWFQDNWRFVFFLIHFGQNWQ